MKRTHWLVFGALLIVCACGDKKTSEREKSTADTAAVVIEARLIPDSTAQAPAGTPEEMKMPADSEGAAALRSPEGKSEADLWRGYQDARATFQRARADGDFEKSIGALLDAARFASALNRPDIEAWQYNNIGYYSILEFKERTDYDARMTGMQAMKPGAEKTAYTEETRSVFRRSFPVLERGMDALEKAEGIHAEPDDAKRQETIESNLRFIQWVRDFLGEKT